MLRRLLVASVGYLGTWKLCSLRDMEVRAPWKNQGVEVLSHPRPRKYHCSSGAAMGRQGCLERHAMIRHSREYSSCRVERALWCHGGAVERPISRSLKLYSDLAMMAASEMER